MDKYMKPPLGVTPEDIHEQMRIEELQRAIIEYASVLRQIPPEWVEEMNRRLKNLKK